MTTANAKSTSSTTKPTPTMPDVAQKVRDQVVSTVKQGQQAYVDAAQTMAKAVSVLPVPALSKLPSVPVVPGMEAVTKYTFGLAADLLSAQQDFALKMTNVLSPKK